MFDECVSRLKRELSSFDDQCFYEALMLAFQAVGRTFPNPPVGSIVVSGGQIVGRGFTDPAGGAHAEINALRQAGSLAQNATLYSTLEPCSHQGRTPPCTESIIKAGIKKVIIGAKDPNPEVNGGGIELLKKAGLEVVLCQTDLFSEQSKLLIAPFAKRLKRKLPWVICKVATSIDGKLTSAVNTQTSISNQASQSLVHQLRNYVDAVMVGSKTVMIDDPRLTVRHFVSSDHKTPVRIVLDGTLKTSVKSSVYQADNKFSSCVVHTEQADAVRCQEFDAASIKRFQVNNHKGHVSLRESLLVAGELGITSVLVECGSDLFSQFLHEKLFDEIWWFVSPKLFGSKGLDAVRQASEFIGLDNITWSKPVLLEEDVLFTGKT